MEQSLSLVAVGPARAVGASGGLADDIARGFVAAQALERRVAEAAVVGPLGEGDLGDEVGGDPVARGAGPGARRLGRERRCRALEGIEPGAEVDEGRVRVARADLAGVGEPAAVVVADEERTEADAAALGI